MLRTSASSSSNQAIPARTATPAPTASAITTASSRHRGAGEPGAVVGHERELLPQPVRVLTGVLAGDGVQVAQALDRDEERLVVVEPGRAQVGDLAPQVVLELVDVGRRDDLTSVHVAAPPVDLGLELVVVRHHAHTSTTAAGRGADSQTCRSASATTSHCACRSASAARPVGVIA